MYSVDAIQFEQVYKQFQVNDEQRSLRSYFMALPFFFSTRKHFIYEVFQNVNFTIKRGECVGIIGPNGSGKSTLLKLICNVLKPTQGYINVFGKIAPLLELGAGFHPELTGRENVYLYGAILGMSKKKVKQNWDSIIEFSQIEKFLGTKIKYYSSGMLVRLGFSVAIHLDYDILIADEVVAVGDKLFQQKCTNHIMQANQSGKTVIFVSHDESLVHKLATKVITIKDRNIEYASI